MAQEGLLLIKASAGSGKTYTLTKLFIEHLLMKRNEQNKLVLRSDAEYFRHMLAITFTNKATDEMKRRIVTELHQLATDVTKSDYCDYFQKQCEPTAFQGLQQAARKALNAILFNYSAFNVSTIDSFFQTILRNFAHELDRDYNYEVQIDADYATSVAVHNFLLALGNDARRFGTTGKKSGTTAEKWVKEFIQNNVSNNKSWNFYNNDNFRKFAQNLNKELFRSHIDQLREYLNDFSNIERFKAMIIKVRDFYRMPIDGSQFAQSIGLDTSKLRGNRALSNLLNKGYWSNSGPSDKMRGLDHDSLQDMFKLNSTIDAITADAIINKVRELVKAYDYAELLDKTIKHLGSLGLLGIIDQKLEEYRRDNNCILIADTNELIGRIVKNSEENRTMPFIYERIGTWINHYMIDEFQDTSRQQYNNFRPLLYESLDKDEDNFNMIIGDAKQSIYRFRNADPSLFREQIDMDFKNRGLHSSNLETNYRSCPNVIEFNNEFCEKLLDTFAPLDTTGNPENFIAHRVSMTYDPKNKTEYKQQLHKTDPPGLVRIITQDSDELPINDTGQVLAMLPDYLLELHKRFRWREIGILINKHEEGEAVVTHLLDYNQLAEQEGRETIPVVSEESMLIKRSPSVRRLISILRFIDLTQYHLTEEDIEDDGITDEMRSFINRKRISNQRLYRVLGDFVAETKNEDLTPEQLGDVLERCFQQHQNDSDVKTMMNEYADELHNLLPDSRTHMLTLTSMVEHIISVFVGSDTVSARETAFLLAFQDCVLDFAQKNSGGTVREFLRYWDSKKISVPASASDDSIKVMTIHKAKGLEFDCVVIPFINWETTKERPKGNDTHIWWLTKEAWDNQAIGNDILSAAPDLQLDPNLVPPLIPIPKKESKIASTHSAGMKLFVEEQLADNLIDNLNKAYVAFTRPREELHLFCLLSKEKDDNKNDNKKKTEDKVEKKLADMYMGDLLNAIAPTMDGFSAVQPGILERGTSRTNIKDEEEENITVDMPPYYVTPAPGKMQVKLQRPKSEAQVRGISLHHLLEHLRDKNDIDKVMNLGVRRGVVRDSGQGWDMAAVRDLLNALCFNADTTAWFDEDNKVYNERTITSIEDGKRYNCRPDRVVKTPDGQVIVIDYKSGRTKQDDIDQVNDYVKLLVETGEKDVKGYIVYLKPNAKPRIVPVG